MEFYDKICKKIEKHEIFWSICVVPIKDTLTFKSMTEK